MVPTRELSEQVAKHLRGLLKYCEKEVTLANLASGTSTHLEKYAITIYSEIHNSENERLGQWLLILRTSLLQLLREY